MLVFKMYLRLQSWQFWVSMLVFGGLLFYSLKTLGLEDKFPFGFLPPASAMLV